MIAGQPAVIKVNVSAATTRLSFKSHSNSTFEMLASGTFTQEGGLE